MIQSFLLRQLPYCLISLEKLRYSMKVISLLLIFIISKKKKSTTDVALPGLFVLNLVTRYPPTGTIMESFNGAPWERSPGTWPPTQLSLVHTETEKFNQSVTGSRIIKPRNYQICVRAVYYVFFDPSMIS